MRHVRLIAAIGVSLLALGVALCLSSVPFGAAATPTTVSGGHGLSNAGGSVRLTAYSDNDGPDSNVVLTGAIGDFGRAVRTYSNGVVVQQYNRLDVMVSHGSFQLKIAGLERGLVRAFGGFPTDVATCSGMEVVSGSAPIVAGSGTGNYEGINGSFTLTATINEVDAWPTCPRTGQRLLTRTVFLTGLGSVTFS